MLDATLQTEELELRQYQRWENMEIFTADPSRSSVPYTIMMPPPNITGNLHMGHALTFTIQDVLARYYRMRGHDVLWQPGTDHAGIATQLVVEQQLAARGVNYHNLDRDSFISEVLSWKVRSGSAITMQLRRLGASPDWSRERFTLDDGLSYAVRKVFTELYKEGLIYRDKRLVNWDPKLHTAISDLEVESRTESGTMWYFRYPIENRADKFIIVATTRPETMLGDTAVAVHPDDERYKLLIGQRCFLPLAERFIPIIADPYVDPQKGSGAIKVTPAHDFNDFVIARRHNLPIINIFDKEACLNEIVPAMYRGLNRYSAREKLVSLMASHGLLERVEDHSVTLPYGDRSGVVIEPWLTEQWFVDVEQLAEPAIRAVENGQIQFIPNYWTETYYNWMRNIQPWCISRQIWWGHQIPAWHGPDGQIFVALDQQRAITAANLHYGQPIDLTRENSVLDTWFSSALWPFSTLGWPHQTKELVRYYPTDVLVTGFDIIFFWVARMIMMSLHIMKDVPFRTVYIHALIRDKHGKKMSKSRGNVVDPLNLVKKYGCDALRFTLSALAVPGRDIRINEQRVIGYRNFVTKLRNTGKFCTIHQCYVDTNFKPVSTYVEGKFNRWIINKTNETGLKVMDAIANFRFDEAVQTIYSFTWNVFCDWYLEFSKFILYNERSSVVAETRATARWVLDTILIIAHPFIPFVTEELWSHRTQEQFGQQPLTTLATMPWPIFDYPATDNTADEVDFVVELVTQIRSIRSEIRIPASEQFPIMITECNRRIQTWVETNKELISTFAGAEYIEVFGKDCNVAKKLDELGCCGAVQVTKEEADIFLLVRSINLEHEKIRLTKEIQRLTAEINRIDQKLSDKAFTHKARATIVEKDRTYRSNLITTKDKFDKALLRLVFPTSGSH